MNKLLITLTAFAFLMLGSGSLFATEATEELPNPTNEKKSHKYYGSHLCAYPEFRCVKLIHAVAAYNTKGELVHWGPVSGGKGWCPDVRQYCNTAVGAFRVVQKQGPECISEKFPVETNGGAPMPYCMHYYRGFALHGSTLPGFHASHGCIRLFHDDAQWLNKHFLKVGDRVVVTRQ